ncbi:MAG: Chagasin family peptidase inhibitor I42 [Candidatus Argoarchaeum ethanivorans]|uniref:Chagasin family peptidase inhibitor I42 n=1 Tax=Candidatus Argoarchaeum ethanivorans TaxID=2608793 RepID=A0A811TCR6_9EURY|nr:MAG: Chagasin family peptidase inhibitor I42 [Candidatus Argoarchaeum ethanivorans]
MKFKHIVSFLIPILILICSAGCIDDGDVSKFNETIMEESQQIADDYVKKMHEYKDFDGRNLELVETLTARCPYCWSFKYEFDMQSEKDIEVVDRATATILVQEGKVVDVVFSAGMKDEKEPEGILNVSKLLEDPVYNSKVGVYGRVDLLGELFCPCFELASGGERVQVWYGSMVEDNETGMPPVSVEGLENGNWVIVTGKLKTAGDHRSLNDFWASTIEKPVSVDKSSGGREVKVSLEKTLAVTLDSNPTTGFRWNLRENSNEGVLQLVGNEFVIAGAIEPPPPGTGGKEVWIFEARRRGASKISMEYIRLWEKDVEPAETFGLTVLVE